MHTVALPLPVTLHQMPLPNHDPTEREREDRGNHTPSYTLYDATMLNYFTDFQGVSNLLQLAFHAVQKQSLSFYTSAEFAPAVH